MSLPKSLKDYVFVAAQVLLFAVYLLPFQIIEITLPEWLRYSGWVLIAIGIVLGVTALLQMNINLSIFPTPVSKAKLLTRGVFSISRHPIYTAVLSLTMGISIYNESLYQGLITLSLGILFYFKSRYEEKLLSLKFPDYRSYKLRTRRFL